MLLVICVLGSLCYLLCAVCVHLGSVFMCVLFCRLGEGGKTCAFLRVLVFMLWGVSGVVCWRNNLWLVSFVSVVERCWVILSA